MKRGTWNVRSLYRAGSLKAAARELGRYKLDVVGVQEVRWDKGGTVREGDYDFFYRKGNNNHKLGTDFFVHRTLLWGGGRGGPGCWLEVSIQKVLRMTISTQVFLSFLVQKSRC